MTLLTLLVLCAILLLFVGALLLMAVVVLWFVLRRGGGEVEDDSVAVPVPDSPRAPFPDPTPAPAPPPVPASLAGNAPLEDSFQSDDADAAKTEVFMRGSLNLEWDEEEQEDGATEIFKAGEDYSLD